MTFNEASTGEARHHDLAADGLRAHTAIGPEPALEGGELARLASHGFPTAHLPRPPDELIVVARVREALCWHTLDVSPKTVET